MTAADGELVLVKAPASRGVLDGPPDAAEDVDRHLEDSGFGT